MEGLWSDVTKGCSRQPFIKFVFENYKNNGCCCCLCCRCFIMVAASAVIVLSFQLLQSSAANLPEAGSDLLAKLFQFGGLAVVCLVGGEREDVKTEYGR